MKTFKVQSLLVLAAVITISAVGIGCNKTPGDKMNDAGDKMKDAASSTADAAKDAAGATKQAVTNAVDSMTNTNK